MPKNEVSDLITDQEMAFVRLLLSGTHTDHGAAQAVGLNPGTAAGTKAKPCVRAYMVGHRAALQQQLLDQETDLSRRAEERAVDLSRLAAEQQSRRDLRREQVLDRLWELAALGPETTRGSITGQVKAISMIVAIEGLIPDRRANSAAKQSTPPLPEPDIYQAAWLRQQQGETIDPQSGPAPAQEQDAPGFAEPEPTPNSAGNAPAPPATIPSPIFDASESAFANRSSSPGTSWVPNSVDPVPDNRVPFSIQRGRFGRR